MEISHLFRRDTGAVVFVRVTRRDQFIQIFASIPGRTTRPTFESESTDCVKLHVDAISRAEL